MSTLGAEILYLSDVMDSSVDGMFLINSEGRILMWNQRMCTISSVDKNQALDNVVIDVLPRQFSRPVVQKAVGLALKGKGNILADKLFFNIGLKQFKFEASFSKISLKDSKEYGCLIVLRDVTNRVNKKSRFKPLIEESPIATSIYQPNGTAKYFNKAYAAIWGVPSGSLEAIGESYNILEDEQLQELGVMPFIDRGFAGISCEIPAIGYNPINTKATQALGVDNLRYIKGHIFPIYNNANELDEVVVVLTDITFQKQAQEILTDTHQKFQMLTMGLPGVIYEFEEIGENPHHFRYISQGCEEMFGFTPEEVMEDATLLDRTIHPGDLESFKNSTLESEFVASEWQWEGRVIVGDKVKWIEGKSSPATLKDGTIVRYGLLLDITEKKDVELQYKVTEERLQLALQGAEVGLWEWEPAKGKTIFNKAWAQRFGYDPKEFTMLFKNWADLIHPDDQHEVQKLMQLHFDGHTEYFEHEYRFKTHSGGYRWIHDRGRATERDHEGNTLRASGTLLDIHDERVTKNMIKHNEQLFTQLFENAPLGIVLLDAEHKVAQMNGGFQTIFGYSKGEIIGNQLNNIIVPDNMFKEAIDINTLTSQGEVGMLQSCRKHKNGKLIPVIIYGVPVTFENKTIGIYGIYVDISERMRIEEELKIRNNELDNFVYKVSHDLRAPLSSILGLVNLANHEQNEDDMKEYMHLIENRIHKLDNFINDVLSHSKNLKMALTVSEINLEGVITKCFKDLDYLNKDSEIKKSVNITGTRFYSDRWRINEIFRNLISNAIKYHDREKDNPFIQLDVNVTKEAVCIGITDNGIGIETSTLPNIYDMFYRATEIAEGSGIGLYIVKNAIEKLGGHIHIESQETIGTKFIIHIPNKSKDQVNQD